MASWRYRHNHLKWLLDDESGVSSRKRDESQQEVVLHDFLLRSIHIFVIVPCDLFSPNYLLLFCLALLQLSPLSGMPSISAYWNLTHYSWPCSKLLLLREGFHDCLWRHKCCFSVASLGLFPSILIFTIVVSMTVSEVPPLKMELDSESHSYQHHTELIADAQ